MMENILLLIIFSYPGVLADMLYTFFAKDKSFYKEPTEAFRVARDFFLSAIIAIATMPIVIQGSENGHTLSNWVSALQKSEVIWDYILVTLGGSIVLSLVWYLFDLHVGLRIKNGIRKLLKLAPESKYKKTWDDLIQKNDHVNIDECAIVIYDANGKQIAAGLPRSIPGDIDEDPHFALAHCSTVINELNDSDDSYLDGLRLVYVDVKTMSRIEFYDASRLYKAIAEAQKEGQA